MNWFSIDLHTLLLILLMGLATYTTRIAGYWLLRGRKVQGRTKAALDAVPAAILMAVIAPTVFMQGPAEMLAGALTLASALLRLPLLVTILVGMASVVLFRTLLN
jgi:uncharacterized membrane protein